jgi:hypothetical protein
VPDIEGGEPLLIGVDVVLGERVDLTECPCADCVEFRARLAGDD